MGVVDDWNRTLEEPHEVELPRLREAPVGWLVLPGLRMLQQSLNEIVSKDAVVVRAEPVELGGFIANGDREVRVGASGEMKEAVPRIGVEVSLLVGLLVELEHLRRDLEILPRFL